MCLSFGTGYLPKAGSICFPTLQTNPGYNLRQFEQWSKKVMRKRAQYIKEAYFSSNNLILGSGLNVSLLNYTTWRRVADLTSEHQGDKMMD